MARLGAGVKRRWSKEFELNGATHRTRYALRADDTLVKEDSYKQFNQYDKKYHWHGWGWKVVKLRVGVNVADLSAKLAASGFIEVT